MNTSKQPQALLRPTSEWRKMLRIESLPDGEVTPEFEFTAVPWRRIG